MSAWRTDTATITVGALLQEVAERFENAALPGWSVLGTPQIVSRGGRSRGLALRASRRLESGIVSTIPVALTPGLRLSVLASAAFGSPTAAADRVALALVPGDVVGSRSADSRSPVRLVALEWLGEARRFAYTVESETWTEPAGEWALQAEHLLSIEIDQSGRAAFYIDNVLRRTSSVRVVGPGQQLLAHILVSGSGLDPVPVIAELTATRRR